MMQKHFVLCAGVLLLALLAGCSSTPKPPRGEKPIVRNMEVTGYCKCKKCCGWERTWYGRPVSASSGKPKKIGQTARGTKAKVGTVAADTNKYPFGTVVHVPGYGYGRVEDRGSAIKGEKLDLYFKTHKQALQWGRQQRQVTIWLP